MRTFILTQRIKIISELHSAFPQAFIAGKLISEPKIAGEKTACPIVNGKAITAGTQIPVVWESSRKNHIKLQYSKVIMFFSYNITTDISPSEKLKDVWHKKTLL